MLRKLDELWGRVEKAGIVAGFLVMSAVVFFDVVHRLSADRAWQTPRTLAILAVVMIALLHFAIRTAKPQTPHPKAIGMAAGGALAIALACWLLVKLMPGGFVWAQTLALVLTIWVGFLGASLATKELKHLKVDAAEKLFKGEAKRWVSVFAEVVSALFTGAMAVLSFMYCGFHFENWRESGGVSGKFESLPLPMFIAFSVLPIAFGVMSLRFAAIAIGHATKKLPTDVPPPIEGVRS